MKLKHLECGCAILQKKNYLKLRAAMKNTPVCCYCPDMVQRCNTSFVHRRTFLLDRKMRGGDGLFGMHGFLREL